MKKMLAILGSPHINGSTAAMLDCVISAATDAGWKINTVNLYQMELSSCTGCRTCITTGKCVLSDNIQEIAEFLRDCDVVTLAAPTYFANVPAIVKNLFDRLLGVALEETATFPKPRLSKIQKYLLLTACNTPFPFSWLSGQSRGTFRAMDAFFKTAGMKCLGRVTFARAKGQNKLPYAVTKRITRYWK